MGSFLLPFPQLLSATHRFSTTYRMYTTFRQYSFHCKCGTWILTVSVGVEKVFQKQHNRVQDLLHKHCSEESGNNARTSLGFLPSESRKSRSAAFLVTVNLFFLCVGRPVYVSAVRPQSKHIVVIIDHGASVTETQLQIARDAALIILNSIDEHDKVRKWHHCHHHSHSTDYICSFST